MKDLDVTIIKVQTTARKEDEHKWKSIGFISAFRGLQAEQKRSVKNELNEVKFLSQKKHRY